MARGKQTRTGKARKPGKTGSKPKTVAIAKMTDKTELESLAYRTMKSMAQQEAALNQINQRIEEL